MALSSSFLWMHSKPTNCYFFYQLLFACRPAVKPLQSPCTKQGQGVFGVFGDATQMDRQLFRLSDSGSTWGMKSWAGFSTAGLSLLKLWLNPRATLCFAEFPGTQLEGHTQTAFLISRVVTVASLNFHSFCAGSGFLFSYVGWGLKAFEIIVHAQTQMFIFPCLCYSLTNCEFCIFSVTRYKNGCLSLSKVF